MAWTPSSGRVADEPNEAPAWTPNSGRVVDDSRDASPWTPSSGNIVDQQAMSPQETAALQQLKQKQSSRLPAHIPMGPQDAFMPYTQPMWDQFAQGEGGQAAAGTLGGVIGGVAGAPFGPAGMLAGGGLGSGIGELLGNVAKQKARGDPVSGQDAYDAFKWGLTTDLIGGLFGDAIGRVGKGAWIHADKIPGMERVANKIKDASRQIMARPDQFPLPAHAAEMAARGKFFVTAAQQTENPLIDMAESVAESSYGGGKDLFQIKKVIGPRAYHQMGDDIIADMWQEAGRVYGPDEIAEMIGRAANKGMTSLKDDFAKSVTRGLNAVPEGEVGQLANTALTASRSEWRKIGGAKYTNIDDVLRTHGHPIRITEMKPTGILDASGRPVVRPVTRDTWDIVPTKNIKAAAKALIDEHPGRLGSSPGIRRIAADAKGRKAYVSFKEADRMRSDILEEARKIETALGSRSGKVTRATTIMDQSIDSSMKAAGDAQSPQVRKAVNEARSYWKKNSELYNNRFVQGLATRSQTGNAANIADYIFKTGSPERVVVARKVLGADAFNQIRDHWLERSMRRSLDDPRSVGGAFKKELDKLGNNTLDAMFGKDQRELLYATSRTFAARGKRGFESAMWRSTLKAASDDASIRSGFINNLITPKGAKTLRAMKRNLSSKEMAAVRALWVQEAVEKNVGKGGFDSVGLYVDALGKELNNLGPVRNELFSQSHLENLYDLAKAELIMGRPTGGGGGILAPLMEAGAVAGLIVSPSKSAAGAIPVLGGFKFLSMVLGDEKAVRFLVDGVKNPARMRLMSQRIIAEMTKKSGKRIRSDRGPRNKPNLMTGFDFIGR